MGSSTVTSTVEELPNKEPEPTSHEQKAYNTDQNEASECQVQSSSVASSEKTEMDTSALNDQQSPDDTDNDNENHSHEKDSSSESNTGRVTPAELSTGDEDGRSASNDLQFKKKDLKRPRTQSFQSVLSTASLKSLRQIDANNPPTLQRNPSYLANQNQAGAGNHKNFQSFIQAPVLSSVSNLRALDNIVIGQQLPFDQKDPSLEELTSRSRHNSSVAQTSSQPLVKDERDDDDEYKEETILQQQKLTLNALKKLSLSLAPIIRSDEDVGPESRQLTTKSLNSSYHPEPKLEQRKENSRSKDSLAEPRTKPYQPAQVDLSSFASLTRQNKHLPDIQPLSKPADDQSRNTNGNQSASDREYHVEMSKQMQNIQSQSMASNSTDDAWRNGARSASDSFQTGNSIDATLSTTQMPQASLPLQSHKLEQSRSEMSFIAPQSQLLSQTQSQNSIMRPKAEKDLDPVVPPMDMNVRNRKSSPTDETTSKHVSMADKRIQQIKGFRNPMYIPAVLRKTLDKDADLGQLSSGSNGDGTESYFEGISRVGSPNRNVGSSSNSLRSVDSTENIGSPGFPTQHKLNKKQYEHILKAAPTRRHWLKDETVSECGIQSCRKQFNFFERRHHCRRCGGIFCKEHTSHYLYINHLAQFTTGGRGTLSRVCDNCIEEYNDFMKQEFGVTCHRPRSSIEVNTMPTEEERESSVPASAVTPSGVRKDTSKPKTPQHRQRTLSPQIKIGKNFTREEQQSNEQVAGSVPANWSWSSF